MTDLQLFTRMLAAAFIVVGAVSLVVSVRALWRRARPALLTDTECERKAMRDLGFRVPFHHLDVMDQRLVLQRAQQIKDAQRGRA